MKSSIKYYIKKFILFFLMLNLLDFFVDVFLMGKPFNLWVNELYSYRLVIIGVGSIVIIIGPVTFE